MMLFNNLEQATYFCLFFFLKRRQEAGRLITSFTTFEAFSNIRIVSNYEKVAKLLYWPSSISSHCVWKSGLVLWALAFDIINKTLLAFALTQGFSTFVKVQGHGRLEVLTIVLLVQMAAPGNHPVDKAACHLLQYNLVPLEEP